MSELMQGDRIMQIASAIETRKGLSFVATLTQWGDDIRETVKSNAGATIHDASFPKRNLGDADIAEYARVMLSSVVDSYFRTLARG